MAVPSIPYSTGLPTGLVDPKKKSPLDGVLDILGSKAGQTAVTAAGAGLQAYGASKSADAARAQDAHQFAATMAQRQAEADQTDSRSRQIAAADAMPLGADQEFAQRNAIQKAILGSARNYSVTPGDPRVAAAMGHSSGGMQLPAGGLDPAMLESLFGDAATQASMAQRAKAVGHIDPNAPVLDTAPMFGTGENGTENPFITDVRQSNATEMQRQLDDSARQRAIIQRAIDEDVNGEKQAQQKHGNIFGKVLKGVGTVASFIPGVGQVVAPIANFAGGMVNGDGLKSAAINAAISAIPGGGGAKSIAQGGIKAGIKAAAKNPALYAGLLSGSR
jgi:hypothetical protein